MPIYEYECLNEKHRFEVIQKFSDPPATHCTICGGPVQRVLSAPAIQFKGSGWYITDYARKGSPDSSTSSTSKTESKSTEKAAESKSAESKPAAVSDSTSSEKK